MFENSRKETVVSITKKFCKADLLILFISALRTESYYYAGILRDEIKNRQFSRSEVQAIKNSQFYLQLNGIFEEHC